MNNKLIKIIIVLANLNKPTKVCVLWYIHRYILCIVYQSKIQGLSVYNPKFHFTIFMSRLV